MEEEVTQQQPDGRRWQIVLVLLCIALVGYGWFYSGNMTTNFGYLAGFTLPFALIIWVCSIWC